MASKMTFWIYQVKYNIIEIDFSFIKVFFIIIFSMATRKCKVMYVVHVYFY